MILATETTGGGEPLLILHGLLGSRENWRAIANALAPRHRVVTVDLRNHGGSPRDPRMDYPSMAADLAETMGVAGIEAAVVMGHSMGGKAAMEFALRHPARTRRLIVVDMAPREYEPIHRPLVAALAGVDLSACATRQDAEVVLRPMVPERPVLQFLLKGLRREPDGAWVWKFDLAAVRDSYEQLRAAIPAARSSPVPALFLRGGNSEYVREADQAGIRELFPAARIAAIPGAGHWPHFDAPAEFVAAVTEWIEGTG